MVKRECSSNRDATCYSDKTLKGMITPKEEIGGESPLSTGSNENSEGKNHYLNIDS
jgi:hypothetical protein